MEVIWVNALSVCIAVSARPSLSACSLCKTKLAERSPRVHASREGNFPSTYYVPGTVPGVSHTTAPFKFHDMTQDSCSHPIVTDEKSATVTERQAKVRQGTKTQTLVSLQHPSFLHHTRPDSCYCFNER